MKPKTKKILKLLLNIAVYALFALILLLTVFIVASGGKGYTSVFGSAFVAVESDSMDGDREDSFQKGALLKLQILSETEKAELKQGEIISFYDNIGGKRVINSHRIIEVWGEGSATVFITQGDNAPAPDLTSRTLDDIIGKVTAHTNGLGNVFLFLRSGTGFAVCIVLPCMLLIGYCVYDLVRAVREQKKESKEQLKEELLKELRAEGKIPSEAEPESKEEDERTS